MGFLFPRRYVFFSKDQHKRQSDVNNSLKRIFLNAPVMKFWSVAWIPCDDQKILCDPRPHQTCSFHFKTAFSWDSIEDSPGKQALAEKLLTSGCWMEIIIIIFTFKSLTLSVCSFSLLKYFIRKKRKNGRQEGRKERRGEESKRKK